MNPHVYAAVYSSVALAAVELDLTTETVRECAKSSAEAACEDYQASVLAAAEGRMETCVDFPDVLAKLSPEEANTVRRYISAVVRRVRMEAYEEGRKDG